MDKQKQIEEMAKAIEIAGKTTSFNNGKIDLTLFKTSEEIAETLYYLNYRKIPGNAVVLTREEQEEFTELYRSALQRAEKWEKLCGIKIKETRKETAEKFAERLKSMAYQSTDWSHGEHPMVVEVDYIDEICEEITEGKV